MEEDYEPINYYYLKNFINNRKDLINKIIGVKPKKILGHGSFGVIYNTNINNIDIKLKRHKNEANVLSRIIELRNKGILLPGIANFNRIIHFKTKRKNITKYKNDFEYIDLFFIIRELLKPIENEKIITHEMPKLSSLYYPQVNLNFYLNEINIIKKILPSLYKTL